MKAKVKLNPTRICVPKYGNALMLVMEYLSNANILPTGILNNGDFIEIILPYTKQSIQPLKQYINWNL